MTRSGFLIFATAILGLLTSCKDDETELTGVEQRLAEARYFQAPVTLDLSELKNEMATGETDLLKSFAQTDFPWQRWDHQLLAKAEQAQTPILVILLSPLNESSRDGITVIQKDAALSESLKSHYVCSLADIYAQPELGTLAYQLTTQEGKAVSFPQAVWLTHKGHPLAWISLEISELTKLREILTRAHLTIDNMWKNDQAYSINNAEADHIRRLKKQDRQLTIPDLENANLPDNVLRDLKAVADRRFAFFYGARRVASFYNPILRDLDGIGGLLPSSSLNLLALQAHHPGTYQTAKRRSREAVIGLFESLSRGAIHDGLDNGYFFARRAVGWTLPSFSKDLGSQALLASSLMTAGALIEEDRIISEGERILKQLEQNWMGSRRKSVVSSGLNQDARNVFLFEQSILEEQLTEDEFALAAAIFDVRPEGNIGPENDFERRYFGLNLLGPKLTVAEASKKLGIDFEKAQALFDSARRKLLEVRKKNATLSAETKVAASDLALFGKAQLARYRARPSKDSLAAAKQTASEIFSRYSTQGKSLHRLPGTIHARGIDYAHVTDFLTQLHQATLDQKWLDHSITVMDEAIESLSREDDLPLMEYREKDFVLPYPIHNGFMIFAESTCGIFDQALGRLAALTENENYQEQRDRIWKALQTRSYHAPITHTELFASCLFGDSPVMISMQKEADIASLAHPKINHFAVIRAATDDQSVPYQISRGSQILAQPKNLTELHQALEIALREKE